MKIEKSRRVVESRPVCLDLIWPNTNFPSENFLSVEIFLEWKRASTVLIQGMVVQSAISANRELNLTHCFGLRISTFFIICTSVLLQNFRN